MTRQAELKCGMADRPSSDGADLSAFSKARSTVSVASMRAGQWGASPRLAFSYIHLSRAIKARNLDVVFMAGPGAANWKWSH